MKLYHIAKKQKRSSYLELHRLPQVCVFLILAFLPRYLAQWSALSSVNRSWMLAGRRSAEWHGLLIAKVRSMAAWSVVSGLHGLRRLDFSSAEITDIDLEPISKMTRLEFLALTGCRRITDVTIARLTTTIKSLDLEDCTLLTDVGMQRLPKDLTRLCLKGCDSVTNHGFHVLSAYTNLTHLDLSHQEDITDKSLHALSISLARLSHLDLTFCTVITGEGLRRAAWRSTLVVLILRYCQEITEKGLQSLTEYTALECLDLTGCDRVTETELAILDFHPSLVSIKHSISWP